MIGPILFVGPDGVAYRALGGRDHRPVGSYVWTPDVFFYVGTWLLRPSGA